MSKAGLHIPSLDGLRAISFGIVFAAHAGLDHVVPGGFGVTVFFFLSGYLITTLMRLEYDKTGHVSLRKFYLRRVLRILPPFYLILSVATLLCAIGFLPGRIELAPLLAQVLHYANYWMISHGTEGTAPGTGVYWSLAVEEHFYLLFPLVYLALRRTRATPGKQAGTLWALCAFILLLRCVLVFVVRAPSDRTYLGSDTRFDSILFGCILAVYGNPALDPSAIAERLWKYLLLPLGVVGLLVSFLFRAPEFRETLRYSLQGVSLLPVFVCAIRYPGWGVMRMLNTRPMAFIGVLSYSLYLVHQVVLASAHDRLRPSLGPILAAVAAFAISLLLAELVHLAVEKPCARLRRRFAS